MARQWTEQYVGGDPDTERVAFERMAERIMLVQRRTQQRAGRHGVPHPVDRAFHATSTLAVDDAELRVLDVPPDLQVGFVQPGAVYRAVVRFSNASGTAEPDAKPDLRGVALRVAVSPERQHDLLMTNYPVSHARDAHQFVEFAVALSGGPLSRAAGVVRLVALFGPAETVRMLRNVMAGRRRSVRSIATETYWSRGAMCWGQDLAVRYLLRPVPGAAVGPDPSPQDPRYLSREIARRLAEQDVQFELCVQRFQDEDRTPVEDTATAWPELVAPPEPVAVLTITRRDLDSATARATARAVDDEAFNPWNTSPEFRPLGNLNRARRAAYDASAAHRSGTRWRTETPLRNVVLGAAARASFQQLNRVAQWYRLPAHVGLLNLQAFRHVLRRDNLLDTEPPQAPPQPRAVPAPAPEQARVARTFDGTYNDLSAPRMGAVGTSFGRNLPPDHRPDLFDEPNPVTVSRELLFRESFLPARSLNVLAAAWIQFQVHDWVDHARHPLGVQDVHVPLPPGTGGWVNAAGGSPEPTMRIAGNIAQAEGADGVQRLFANQASHWWDGSEVYGTDEQRARSLRDGAKLRLTPEGYLPEDTRGFEVTGFNQSWWLGLSGLHTLFAREHNLLCDELRAHYRGMSDDAVYDTARLIVSALIAKIHTIEWTPAVLGTRTLDIGMHSNWNGPPARDWLTRLGIWLMDTHAAVGIPKTKPDHHGVPYSLTEDFVTVYRMHPLLPDDYAFHSADSGALLGTRGFLEIQGDEADDQLRALGLRDTLYSFGTSHPGAITLHNYPRSLQAFERDGERVDLSVVDLVRTRRRGVPRYNDFRAGLHKPRIERWEDLSDDPVSVDRLRQVYRSIDEVDTMVGLFAETPPPGFGFSDTAFRIFILMASRRLQSDRFLTIDFRPEVYTPLGMDWVAANGMTSVLLRHCPDLAAVLPRDANAFAPWRTVPAADVRTGPAAPAPRQAPRETERVS